MKIGLLSDTHGYIDDHILSLLSESDEIWHAGDIGDWHVIERLEEVAPVRAVFGNIDSPDICRRVPEDNIFDIEGMKVAITHIGGYPGKYSKHGRQLIQNTSPRIFITGHSHILKVMNDQKYDLLHINPGAAGRSGFHQIRTMIRFEINSGRPEKLEVIELGKRGK